MSIVDKLSTIKTNTTLVYDAGVEVGVAQGGASVNLDTEIAAQDELITELNSILDTKASGGGTSTEVCMISIDNMSPIYSIVYQKVSNGTVQIGSLTNPAVLPVVLSDVLLGGLVVCISSFGMASVSSDNISIYELVDGGVDIGLVIEANSSGSIVLSAGNYA